MKALVQYKDHRTTPARVYERDLYHADRIQRLRKIVQSIATEGVSIIELGCGTADIVGPFSDYCTVTGYDCNLAAVTLGIKRFPKMHFLLEDFIHINPVPCHILVLSEILEHIPDPIGLVRKWLPLAKYVVISHPFEEPLEANMSEGEHCWSYDLTDFKNWFILGQHELRDYELFAYGVFTCITGVGSRI